MSRPPIQRDRPAEEAPRHEGMQRSETANPARESARTSTADGDIGRSADAAPSGEEALRERVAELETTKTALDKKVADQGKRIEELKAETAQQDATNTALWKKIADQDRKLEDLTAGIGELRRRQDELDGAGQPAAAIGRHEREPAGETGEIAVRAKPERRWGLPSDTANNLIALVVGGGLTEAADHIRQISPEFAGIGATVLAVGAGSVAWWRERGKKAESDEGHRPEG